MVIFILERVPARVRGDLSRWMIEPRTGVFVGSVSALVRDKLWARICAECEKLTERNPKKRSGALLIQTARTEQGFAIRSFGDPSREIMEMEGLALVRIPKPFLKPDAQDECKENP